MARRRFFVDEVRNGRATLADDDARHLSQVLRAEPGQCYELSDNRAVYLAEIESIGKDRVSFRIIEELPLAPATVRITLLAALVKFDRFEWMIEKATELGVAAIVPVEAARSETGLARAAAKRLERWRKIARESSQQSRRDRLPDLHSPAPLEAALTAASGPSFFLEEQSGACPLLAALPAGRRPADQIYLSVGPEGGWTDEERAIARRCGWTPVSLGPTVLRAETAAIAALAIVTNAWLTTTAFDAPVSPPLS